MDGITYEEFIIEPWLNNQLNNQCLYLVLDSSISVIISGIVLPRVSGSRNANSPLSVPNIPNIMEGSGAHTSDWKIKGMLPAFPTHDFCYIYDSISWKKIYIIYFDYLSHSRILFYLLFICHLGTTTQSSYHHISGIVPTFVTYHDIMWLHLQDGYQIRFQQKWIEKHIPSYRQIVKTKCRKWTQQ